MWAVALLVGAGYGWAFPDQPTRLTFLSVGQGDCAVFQTQGTTVLIDAGPKSENYDSGKRLVLPRLAKLGVRSVDLILLTHPDEDHIGGTGSILRAYPGARLAISEQFRNHPGLVQHLKDWRIDPNSVLWLGAVQHLRIAGFDLKIRNPVRTPTTTDNEASMFLRLERGIGSAMLSGDAGSQTERVMEPLEDWSSQVMKAGHHGSRSSTSESWLREVRPSYAVISCGRNNVYGHPAAVTLRRLAQKQIPTLRTDQFGDIRFEFDETRGFVLNR